MNANLYCIYQYSCSTLVKTQRALKTSLLNLSTKSVLANGGL